MTTHSDCEHEMFEILTFICTDCRWTETGGGRERKRAGGTQRDRKSESTLISRHTADQHTGGTAGVCNVLGLSTKVR